MAASRYISELSSLKFFTKQVEEWNGIFFQAHNQLESISNLLLGLKGTIEDTTKPWVEAEDTIKQLGKAAGVTIDAEKLFNDVLLSTNENVIGLNQLLGVNIKRYKELQEGLSKQLNRNIQLGRQFSLNESNEIVGLKEIDIAGVYASIDSLFGDSGTKLAQYFMDFGLGITEAGKEIEEIIQDTRKVGINSKKVTEYVSKNIAKASSFTFKNGIAGLKNMAENAAKVNFNMENTFKLAEKFNGKDGLTSAIQTGANLQVLGGQFTKASNPLEMFYEATSDVGKLQERIVDMFKGMGTYDKFSGITYSRENRMRIQAAASQLGINPEEIFTMINTNATKEEIARQVGNRYSGKDLELLQNVATIEGGNAMVSVGGRLKKIEELKNGDLEQIRKERSMASNTGMTLVQIAQDLRSIKDVMESGDNEKEMSNAIFGKKLTANDLLGLYKGQMKETSRAIKNMDDETIMNLFGVAQNEVTSFRGNFVNFEKFIDSIGTIEDLKDTIERKMSSSASTQTFMSSIRGIDTDGTLRTLIETIDNLNNTNGTIVEEGLKYQKELLYNPDFVKYLFAKSIRSSMYKTPAASPDEEPDININGGSINVAHADGGALQPATASARQLVSNGGFTNDYYNNLGSTVMTPYGPEKMLTQAHAMGNSIGMNEYVISSKALKNMGNGNIQEGIHKADMINFGGVKPFATGGEIKVTERPNSYYGGGALSSNNSLNASGNISVSMPNLGGRITLALEGANKTRDFDVKANAEAIYNAIAPMIQRKLLNAYIAETPDNETFKLHG